MGCKTSDPQAACGRLHDSDRSKETQDPDKRDAEQSDTEGSCAEQGGKAKKGASALQSKASHETNL